VRRRSELASVLAHVQLFSKCSQKDLAAVAREVEVIEFAEGDTIVRQGEAANAFYVVLDGMADVRRNGKRVGRLAAGDYFGELALLDPAPRNADVVAATPVTVGRLLANSFRDVLKSVPAIRERLLVGLARRLRDADRRAVE
jgi:cAMP-dependent protein kinase regulator